MGNYWIARVTVRHNRYFHLSSQNWEVIIYNVLRAPAEDKAASKWRLLRGNGLTDFHNIQLCLHLQLIFLLLVTVFWGRVKSVF